ncbi:hypothetical protein LOTGIDRAFT_158127 [Lottia gigantea]|uniref:RING-type domain-containing protein n=1 Tax=Lottia gigantea TaxID=225164 RepID=V4AY39_LOTGI|nr:hypothetical protein LOTGIDRAFT_158127 [Lottia gigantea]ESO99960.1 hypothetical protein LOTGIDRAFT_158127 [Lottia gigantea]
MAAESKTRFDKQSTISFTLPISCQICLGKVKQPVLCPNNHVFCGSCMEVWLSRNQQCPSCRVDINPGNPIQQIRGGLNHFDEENERLNTNPQMRKARFELLYKEYEDEFERLEAEIQILKSENDVLRSQVKRENGYDKSKEFTHPSSVDGGQVLALTRKLQDAQKQYDRLKQEANRNKQENNELKDENVNLNRENERLRLEIVSRSPHRYGRFTVATLESKVEGYEKEIKQLNKALERSDKYIEDLQKQLELYGHKQPTDKPKLSKDYSDFNGSILDTKSEVDASKRRLFTGDGNFSQKSAYDKTDPVQFALDLYRNSTKSINSENDVATASQIKDKAYPNPESPGQRKWKKSALSGNSPQKDRTPKKVQFDLKKENDSASSFDLDRPSPLTPSTYMGKLSLLDKKSPSSARKNLNFAEFDRTSSSKSARNLELGSQESLDDTGQIKSELDELNISMTPELSDCMKLMNRAEKNVHVSKYNEESVKSKGIANFVAPVGSLVPGMTFNTIMNEYPLSVYHLSCNNDVSLSENQAPESRHSVSLSSSNPNYLSSTTAQNDNYQNQNFRNDGSRHMQINRDAQIGQVHLSASSSSFPFNPPLGSRSHPITSHLTSQQPSYHSLPLSSSMMLAYSQSNNTPLVSQSNIPPLSNKQTDINQNFSTLGLSDMVRRGQDILKTMDLKHNDVRSLTPVVSAQPHSSYTSSVSQFQPILSTRAETKSNFYDALISKSKVINGIEAPNFTKGNNFANLPKFDIPQSLIIPSPNLSAEFAADKQSNGSQPKPQNGTLHYQSKPSVDCQSKNVPPPSLPSYQSSNQNLALANGFSKSLHLSAAKPPASIPPTTISSHFFSSTGFSSSDSLPSTNPESHASTSQQQPQKPTELFQNSSQMNGNQQQTSKSAKGDNSMNSLDFSGTGNSDSFRLEAPTGNYSYVSNDLSSRGSDSFLPEPKKRLFQTDDSLDISMSPIKTSRHY